MTTRQETNLAGEALKSFEVKQREGGGSYVTLKDERPDWVHDLVYVAHGSGEFLPDDWRYATIHDALEMLSEESGDATDFADAVDVYTSDLHAWLSSNSRRQSYCDEAAKDGLVPEDATLDARIMVGQSLERQEVFELVRGFLEEHANTPTIASVYAQDLKDSHYPG